MNIWSAISSRPTIVVIFPICTRNVVKSWVGRKSQKSPRILGCSVLAPGRCGSLFHGPCDKIHGWTAKPDTGIGGHQPLPGEQKRQSGERERIPEQVLNHIDL